MQQQSIVSLFYNSSLDLYFTKALVLSLDVELGKMLKSKSAFDLFSKFWIRIDMKTRDQDPYKTDTCQLLQFCLG
jgi:hypothetical protein